MWPSILAQIGWLLSLSPVTHVKETNMIFSLRLGTERLKSLANSFLKEFMVQQK